MVIDCLIYWISPLTYLPAIDGHSQQQTLNLRNQATAISLK